MINPEHLKNDISFGLIEIGEGSEKLSSDFRYVFGDKLKLGETVGVGNGKERTAEIPEGKYDAYICCAYDRGDAVKILSKSGLEYKALCFSTSFFALVYFVILTCFSSLDAWDVFDV